MSNLTGNVVASLARSVTAVQPRPLPPVEQGGRSVDRASLPADAGPQPNGGPDAKGGPQLDGGPVTDGGRPSANGGPSVRGDSFSISDVARFLAARNAGPMPPESRGLPEGVEVSREGGEFTVSRELERPGGRTSTRELSLSFDPSEQSVSRERTFTTADGRTLSIEGSVQRTENGYERSFTVTGLNGEQVTRTVSQSFDPKGEGLSRTVTLEGGTYDLERNVQVRRAATGLVAQVDLEVSRNGDTATGGDVEPVDAKA